MPHFCLGPERRNENINLNKYFISTSRDRIHNQLRLHSYTCAPCTTTDLMVMTDDDATAMDSNPRFGNELFSFHHFLELSALIIDFFCLGYRDTDVIYGIHCAAEKSLRSIIKLKSLFERSCLWNYQLDFKNYNILSTLMRKAN